MKKVLALDYGRARIGLAVCDALGISCRPLPALQRTGGEADLRALQRLCEEEGVEALVVGLPLQLDGEEGLAAREVRTFIETLRQNLGLPVEEVDERLTSRQAHAVLKDAGIRHKRRKELVDSTAAVLLLQAYLARLRGRPSGQ